MVSLEHADTLFIQLWVRAAMAESGSQSLVELERKARNIPPKQGAIGKRYKWYLVGRRPTKRTIHETAMVAENAAQWLETPLLKLLQGRASSRLRRSSSKDPVLLALEAWAHKVTNARKSGASSRQALLNELNGIIANTDATDWMQESRPEFIVVLTQWLEEMLTPMPQAPFFKMHRQMLCTSMYAAMGIVYCGLSITGGNDPFFVSSTLIMSLISAALAVVSHVNDFNFPWSETALNKEL